MSNIIKNWLADRLGVIVDVESSSFIRMVQSGYLIAKLLHSLNLITEEQLLLITSAGDAANGLDQATAWLGNIGVDVDYETKNDIKSGRLSSAIKLFWKLYLALKNKDRLHFISQQVEAQKLRPESTRFRVKPAAEEVEDPSDVGPHPLSHPLEEFGHVIHWHEDRYAILMDSCMKAREKYKQYVHDNFTKKEKEHKPFIDPRIENEIPDTFLSECKSVNFTYEELLAQQTNAQNITIQAPDPKISKQIIKKIQQKTKQGEVETILKTQMEKILLDELWNNILNTEEKKFETEISKKMLKQSVFEKQVSTKLFEVREQKNIMLESKQAIEEEVNQKKNSKFMEQIFFKARETGEERCRYYIERDRTLELHKRIYAEKLRLKAQRKQDMCWNIVEDMVDIALYMAEYSENYKEEENEFIKNELAALFVAEQPIFSLIDEPLELIAEPQPENMDEIYLQESERQNAVNDQYFDDYCNFRWPWELDQHAPDLLDSLINIELAMNILGHIVFRLLLMKYPKPLLPAPPDIPKVDVAVCVNNLTDPNVLVVLNKLLAERQVKIIQMEDVINYCLEAYKLETTIEYPETQFLDETEKALRKAKEGKKKGRNRKKGKISADKQSKKSKGRKKKKFDTDLEEEVPPFQEKQVQTPRLFPGEELVLSPKAELGRLAFEILGLGEALNDNLLVQMFVEYLMSLKGIKGWVLINYPQSFEQAALLEEALTSVPVPRISSLAQFPSKEVSDKPDNEEININVEHLNKNSLDVSLTEIDKEDLKKKSSNVLLTEVVDKDAFIKTQAMELLCPAIETEKGQCNSDCICQQAEITNDVTDLADLEYRNVPPNDPTGDKNAEFRVSKLLINPDLPPPENEYDTYLTAYISVVQSTDDEYIPYFPAKDEKQPSIDIFYQNQGNLYILYYKVYDFPTIKHLAKLIVGDYSMPPKTSVQIFGDTVLYLEDDFNQDYPTPGKTARSAFKGKKKEKKPKSKSAAKSSKDDGEPTKQKKKNKKSESKKSKKSRKSNKNGSDKESKKGKKGKKKISEGADVVIVREDKETQIPEIEPEIEIFDLPESEPKPGELKWKYSDLSIPDFFQAALATLWENVEAVYISDFKDVIFSIRLLWRDYIPYVAYVKMYLQDFIARPDKKQTHLNQFQKIYNELDADMRDDDEVKAELQCRIYEFRERLWEICDQRMREAEEERKRIVDQDWVTKQTCELTNGYISLLQLELDRSTDTFQLLNDYYTAMITKMPTQNPILDKQLLTCIPFSYEFGPEGSVTYSNFVQQALRDGTHDDIPNASVFHKLLYKNFDAATTAIKKYQKVSLDIVAKMERYFQPKGAKKTQPESKSKGQFEKKLPKFSEPAVDVKQAGLKLIEEWRFAINGEALRVNCRLRLIKSFASSEIQMAIDCTSKAFYQLKNDIVARYEREIKGVENACAVLSRAVEEEIPLQPELILDGDRFYIKPSVLLFKEPLPEPEAAIKEYERNEAFSIEQLSNLTDILLELAPNGILPERAFVYLLQDMIVQNAEDDKPPMIPVSWQKITTKKMNQLSIEFFGNVELVDWKDFIIYNLCVDFPDEEELMHTRRQFREHDPNCNEYVYSYQFSTVQFWFEKNFDKQDPHERFRLNKIKELLYKIYRISEEASNYTALLLTFCKDDDPIIGVAKALQLSLGKYVCWHIDIGEAFKDIVRQNRELEEQERIKMEVEELEKVEIAGDVVEELIDKTVHTCDSCYLEESRADESESNVSEKEVPLEQEGSRPLSNFYDNAHASEEEQEHSSGFLLEEEFSNVEIGFEANANPPKAYYLPFEVLSVVLMAAMPWHAAVQNVGGMSFRQKLEVAYESCRNSEFENLVLMHEFLNSDVFKNLLQCCTKFVVKKPTEIVSQLIKNS